MLLRVVRPLSGSVDGVDLTQFEAGSTYNFSNAVASFLLAIGAAEPAGDDAQAVLWPGKRVFDTRRPSAGAALPWTGVERRRNVR